MFMNSFLDIKLISTCFESSTVPCFVSSYFFVDLLSSSENTTYVQICFFSICAILNTCPAFCTCLM